MDRTIKFSNLIASLDDDRNPVDNNAVENAIRPFVIDRKDGIFADAYGLYRIAQPARLRPFSGQIF